MGLFDQDFRLTKLTQLGDPLERLSKGFDFELFRPMLSLALTKVVKGAGGRRPYDYVTMFKILVLQRYYNSSDNQVEFQICDRLSFMRFLGLTIADDVPDSKTVWLFREQLIDLELVEKLFDLFLSELARLNLVVNEGQIVDASFVEVPRQRNSREDNKTIKEGAVPEKFKENPHRLSQKDIDARCTQKNQVNYFGYKNHVKTDAGSKIITKYKVTDASVHDLQEILGLLTSEDKDQELFADSAYTGEDLHKELAGMGIKIAIHEKGYKNRPLTDEQ